MPPSESSETPDPLSSQLRAWRLQPQRTPEFRAAVSVKIATARRAGDSSLIGYLRGNGLVVTAALALAILGGAFAGREQARTRVASANTQLAAAYVQAHDARTMQMP